MPLGLRWSLHPKERNAVRGLHLGVRVTFCKMCEKAFENEQGVPEIHGRLVDSVSVQSFPTPFPPLVLALELEIAPTESGRPFVLEAILVDEDGRRVLSVKGERRSEAIERPHPGLWFEAIPIPADLVVKYAGTYRWDILVNGQLLTSERLIFRLADPKPLVR